MTRLALALGIASVLSVAQSIAADVASGGRSNAIFAGDIASDEELNKVVTQLDDPATEMDALRRLIKFAGGFLYEGSLIRVTGDPIGDELRRSATRALRSHRSLDNVRRALDDEDRSIRFWGVMSFEFIYGRQEPWVPLLPRLEDIATRDEDAAIRREAISKLQYYGEAAAFLRNLRESSNETDPEVLMTLLRFDSQNPSTRAIWYARATNILSGKEDILRSRWMSYIWFNVWNPSTAPMWRIEAAPALVKSLRQIELTGQPKEQELATRTLRAFSLGQKTGAQPGGSANRSKPLRSETNSASGAAGSADPGVSGSEP